MNLPISRRSKILGFAFGLTLTFVLLAAITGLVAVLAPAAGSELLGAAPQGATPTVSGEVQCAKLYPLDGRGSAAAQQSQKKRYDACVQAYNTRLTPKPVLPLQLTLEAPRTIFAPTAVVPRTPAGAGTILESGASPLSSMYVIENSWVFETQDRIYSVYAGGQAEEGPPQPRSAMQGLVSVWVWKPNGEPFPGGDGGTYDVPVKNGGSVKIVGAQGQRLILKTDNGTTYYFDLPTRQFVSALAATVTPVAPTVPPYP
jgi:hypothetical protein